MLFGAVLQSRRVTRGDLCERVSGVLSPTDATRERLADMRRRSGIANSVELPVDELRAVEAALSHRFHDDILALFACGLPLVNQHWRMRLSLVVGHTGALQQRGVRGDLIGIGGVDASWIAVQKSATGTSDRVIVGGDGSPTTMSCWQWIDRLATETVGDDPGTDAGFEPRLVAAVLESSRAGRRVRHKVFGEGLVLSDTGVGDARRVQVEFPGHRLKLLAARFVEFVDD